MFRIPRLAILGTLLAFSASSFADNSVLIIQSLAPMKDGTDPNVGLADYLAQEFDNEGKLIPIVYSVTDPAFRDAVQTGRVKGAVDKPTMPVLFEVARQFKSDYVIVLESTFTAKGIKAKLKLLKDKRQIWKDEQDMAVSMGSQTSIDNTSRSIARTLLLHMTYGPLKALPERQKAITPEPAKGQAPKTEVPVVEIKAEDNSINIDKQVESLLKSGKSSSAILVLRDAVDAQPLAADRRLKLIELLVKTDPMIGAQEARRSALVMPDHPEFRSMAARAWIQAGHPEEAQKDLNESVARDPNGSKTRELLGQLSLEQLDPEKAIEHFDAAIKVQDTARIRFMRAICRSLLGNAAGMGEDLEQVSKLDPKPEQSVLTERYNQLTDIYDRVAGRDAVEIRTLTQKAVVKPHDKTIKAEIDAITQALQVRTTLLSIQVPPTQLSSIHERRILAHKLLAQSLLGLKTFWDKGDEDSISDSRIDLGEAMKQLAAIKKKS